MRGASALEAVLDQTRQPLAAFVIWESVLPTDSRPPDRETLGLLKDQRVRQLWDPGHLVSTALRDGMKAHPTLIPVARQRRHGDENGTLWDAVAVFPPAARWEETMPAPAYLDGDVVNIVTELERRLGLPIP